MYIPRSNKIEVGPAPYDEECAQVGQDDYRERSQVECAVYIRQLNRIFGTHEPCVLSFVRQGFPHDFGRYYEVVACMNRRGERIFDEGKLPAQWDHIARAELTWSLLSRRYRQECWDGRRDELDIPALYLGAVPDFPDHPVANWLALGFVPMPDVLALPYH